MIIKFESNTPTPLVLAFTALLSDFNLLDDTLYVPSSFKRFKGYFLKKLKM